MLNDSIEFSIVAQKVRDAFVGKVDKVSLLAGTQLFKLTDFALIGGDGITPWWCFVRARRLPSGHIVDGFRMTEELSRRLGVPLGRYMKTMFAVGENLGRVPNQMRGILLTELTADVWGFAGKASGQREFSDPKRNNVYLIGGGVQVWIPNLTKSHIRQIHAERLDLQPV